MRVYEFARRVIAPVVAAIFLAALFYPLCVENGVCDYLKLWVLMGIPFGVHRMFVWVIPKEFELGGMIMAWRLTMAVVYLAWYVGKGIFWLYRKVMVRETT